MPEKKLVIGGAVGGTVVGSLLLLITGVNMVVRLLRGVDMFYWPFSAVYNLMIPTGESHGIV